MLPPNLKWHEQPQNQLKHRKPGLARSGCTLALSRAWAWDCWLLHWLQPRGHVPPPGTVFLKVGFSQRERSHLQYLKLLYSQVAFTQHQLGHRGPLGAGAPMRVSAMAHHVPGLSKYHAIHFCVS